MTVGQVKALAKKIAIQYGGGGGGTLTNITALVDAGAINTGDVITSGITLDQFVKKILLTTFFPTFVAPSATLTSSIASNIESGSIANNTLTLALNRGSINGKLVGGIWNPSTMQDYRGGVASDYTIQGTSYGLVNSNTINNYQVVDGANTFDGVVSYDEGVQPKDSDNNNYDIPLVAGSIAKSITVNGRRNLFHGSDSANNTTYTTSTEVRALSNKVLNPANATTFTINVPVGAKMVVFAYPDTLRDVTTVKYVEGLNAEVKGIFSKTTVSVEGANGYNAINYKVYTYIPASPFGSGATYNVTI